MNKQFSNPTDTQHGKISFELWYLRWLRQTNGDRIGDGCVEQDRVKNIEFVCAFTWNRKNANSSLVSPNPAISGLERMNYEVEPKTRHFGLAIEKYKDGPGISG